MGFNIFISASWFVIILQFRMAHYWMILSRVQSFFFSVSWWLRGVWVSVCDVELVGDALFETFGWHTKHLIMTYL